MPSPTDAAPPGGSDPSGAFPGGPGTPPGLTGIDHVGIAVADVEAATRWYEEVLGARVVHREEVGSDGVVEVLLGAGGSFVQLLHPTRPTSPVAAFLERRGQGVHHVAYRVADCAASLEAALAAGATPVDRRPRPGSRGTTVAFLHPSGAFGTLVELVQAGRDA